MPLEKRSRSVTVDAAGIRQPERCNDDKAQKVIDDYDALTLRTAEFIRKLVLFDSSSAEKTEVAEMAQGQVDARIQLILQARDEGMEAKGMVRLGYFREMRGLLNDVSKENAERISARAAVLEANKDRLLKATLATGKNSGPTITDLMNASRAKLGMPSGN
jgi:hypothetical protein